MRFSFGAALLILSCPVFFASLAGCHDDGSELQTAQCTLCRGRVGNLRSTIETQDAHLFLGLVETHGFGTTADTRLVHFCVDACGRDEGATEMSQRYVEAGDRTVALRAARHDAERAGATPTGEAFVRLVEEWRDVLTAMADALERITAAR